MIKEKYEKYEFEIPKGWRVYNNYFYKLDPSDETSDDDKFDFIFCHEDMLLIENHEYHLDLGWYGDESGNYTIHFFKGNWLVGELLEKYSSNRSYLIAERVGEILTAFKNGEFVNIKGFIVDENDENNHAQFADIESFQPRIK